MSDVKQAVLDAATAVLGGIGEFLSPIVEAGITLEERNAALFNWFKGSVLGIKGMKYVTARDLVGSAVRGWFLDYHGYDEDEPDEHLKGLASFDAKRVLRSLDQRIANDKSIKRPAKPDQAEQNVVRVNFNNKKLTNEQVTEQAEKMVAGIAKRDGGTMILLTSAIGSLVSAVTGLKSVPAVDRGIDSKQHVEAMTRIVETLQTLYNEQESATRAAKKEASNKELIASQQAAETA